MGAKQTCITIGDHITAISVMESKRGMVRPLCQCLCPTPPNCITNGLINDGKRLSEFIRAETQKRDIQTKKLSFSISSAKIISKEMLMPAGKDIHINDMVEANASDHFPMDLELYHLAHTPPDTTRRGGQTHTRVMVYAAPLTLLRPYIHLAELLEGKIDTLDCAVNGQYQTLRRIAREETCVCIHMDSRTAQLIFLWKGQLLQQRSLPDGVFDYIRAHMEQTDIPEEQFFGAYEAMCKQGEAMASPEGMNESFIETQLARCIGGLQHSIDHFNRSFWEMPVASVLLGGPCARVCGVRDVLQKHLGLPVDYYEDALPKDERRICGDNAGCYQSNLGAMLEPLDLIPPEFRSSAFVARSKRKTTTPPIGVPILLALALIAIALVVQIGMDKAKAQREYDRVADAIEAYGHIEDVYKTYLDWENGAQIMEDIRRETQGPNSMLADFLEELETNLPSDITLLSMNSTRQFVVLNVTLSSKVSAAAMLVQLRAFDSLESISTSAVTESGSGEGKQVSLTVTCYYKQPDDG